MAGHALIDAHLAALRRRRLPGAAVDELADGLTETYERRLLDGFDPDSAATTAVTEFGTVGEISEAFGWHAPGHRAARTLLTTGPIIGSCWVAFFITGRAWTWPHARTAALILAAGLMLTIGLLEVARLRCGNYAQIRAASLVGIIGAIAIDAAVLTTATVAAPIFVWPILLAGSASLARIGFAIRTLPAVLARCP
jgi:hypothetical protein